MPFNKLEATSKVYVDGQDYKKVSKAGDVITGNLKLNITGSANSVRSLVYSGLIAGNSFQLLQGNIENRLEFSFPYASATKLTAQTLVTFQTRTGILVSTNGDGVCRLSILKIMIYEDADIHSHKSQNLQNLANAQDAATKQYVDDLKDPGFNAENTGNVGTQNLIVNENKKIIVNAKVSDIDSKFSNANSRFHQVKQDIIKSMQTSCLILLEHIIMKNYTCTKTVISIKRI